MPATNIVQRSGEDQFRGVISNTVTVVCTMDLASISTGSRGTDTIAVPGVAVGDIVLGVSFGVDVAGLNVEAYVSAANVVTVVAVNNTGSPVDLASTTVRVLVGRMVP